MKVYHGSSEKQVFEVFDYNKIGTNSTVEGFGFYFTDNIEIAEKYISGEGGHLYIVDFKGKKSLSNEKITITRPQLRKYLIKLNTKTDFLSNYGDIDYEGLEKVLNRALEEELSNSNDVDLIGGICNATSDIEICLTMLYDVLGYDSIMFNASWGEQKLCIALVNDIINILEVKKY